MSDTEDTEDTESTACFINLHEDQSNWNGAKLFHRSSNSYARKIIQALLISKLPNLSAGQWELDLPSLLVNRL